jgi:branched-chain amino acid transport system permease protein
MRWGAVIAVVLALFPLLVTDPFYCDVATMVLLWAIAASAWNLLGGYAGQISVGHAVFFGMGGYVPLLFYTYWGTPPIAGLPAGLLLTAAVAFVLGLPTLRLHGHYFTMSTIAVAELARILVTNWPFAGGAIGLNGPAVARTWLDLSFGSPVPYYYLFLGTLALVLLLTHAINRSRFGFYLRALRSGERGARSLGVPVWRYKVYALLLSAVLTSVAGSLYAFKFGFVDPESAFGILVSVQSVIFAALGGAGTLFGPFLGALVLVPVATASNALFGGTNPSINYVVYGGIIMLIARFEPGGITDLWHRFASKRDLRSAARDAA